MRGQTSQRRIERERPRERGKNVHNLPDDLGLDFFSVRRAWVETNHTPAEITHSVLVFFLCSKWIHLEIYIVASVLRFNAGAPNKTPQVTFQLFHDLILIDPICFTTHQQNHLRSKSGSTMSSLHHILQIHICVKKDQWESAMFQMDGGLYHLEKRIGINLIPVKVSQ